jgi:putative ABC transport system substrate-binding protein
VRLVGWEPCHDAAGMPAAATRRDDRMNRRRLLVGAGAAAAALPLRGLAQARPRPVLGFLKSASSDTYAFNAAAFRDGLREGGFVDGESLRIEYRWAAGDYGRLPALAADLVRANIAATGDIASARAAQAATKTIPIVFTVGSDPVQFGLVSSLSRPGANATGITLFSSTLSAKRLELWREVLPNVTLVALLMNPSNPNVQVDIRAAQEAAQSLGRTTVVVNADRPDAFDAAFAQVVREKAGAILVASDPMFLGQRQRLVGLAARYRIPAMYWTREFAEAGGLIFYGTSITWMYHQAGVYCARILKGAKPSDLPILQPQVFETFINPRAADALGLKIPQATLLRGEVVE